ncbi:MAG: pyridoxamine 5'-phosphate oxidase family protein [Propionibacteriaceae bacterium]|nr:pyridoxamine 5'-phosphate oxidase family protein [Propionibacteriaceae bacterium]
MEALSPPSLTPSRHRERQSESPSIIQKILAEGMVAHIGFVRDGWPVVIPFHYGLGDLGDGNGVQMLVHGSTGGRAFLTAASSEDGIPVSVCVSFNDGLVLGRSAYNTGARYRSVVAFGRARLVPAELRPLALDLLMDHILTGRRDEVRTSTRKEIASTAVLSIPLDHASAKVAATSMGDSDEDEEDLAIWAGVIPVTVRAGTPVASPLTKNPRQVPESVRAFVARMNGDDD